MPVKQKRIEDIKDLDEAKKLIKRLYKTLVNLQNNKAKVGFSGHSIGYKVKQGTQSILQFVSAHGEEASIKHFALEDYFHWLQKQLPSGDSL